MECFKCGVDSGKSLLYEVISPEGVVHACRSCCEYFDYPILNKAFNKIFEKPFDNSSVRNVLNRISGVDIKKSSFNTNSLPPEEKQLKELVDSGFRDKIETSSIPLNELIDNFHWLIMRKRRALKMTQKQLAEAIDEPEMVVIMAEKGKLSSGSPFLIDKFEKYFSIKLRKSYSQSGGNSFLVNNKGFDNNLNYEPSLPLDRFSSKHVTIGELRRIKQNILNETPEITKFSEEKSNEIVPDLDQKDIDDLIFGRK